MYRFNYFTQKASEVLNLAIKAAENFGHNYVGSEHILLGLLKVDGGVAHSVLESRNVTLEDIPWSLHHFSNSPLIGPSPKINKCTFLPPDIKRS